MIMKDFIRRVGMTLLFMVALYTTISVISNMTIMDYKVWNEQRLTQMATAKSSLDKNPNYYSEAQVSLLETKTVDFIVNQNQTIEEVANLEQYLRDTVVATGYTAGIESTGKTVDHPEYGITFSGVEVKRDLYSTIAADLSIYPIGTIMYIPDYGYGVVADKGSAIKGNKIDLYYETVEDVYAQWGKKEVDVYIIKLGDGQLSEDELVMLNENETLQVFREQFIK